MIINSKSSNGKVLLIKVGFEYTSTCDDVFKELKVQDIR